MSVGVLQYGWGRRGTVVVALLPLLLLVGALALRHCWYLSLYGAELWVSREMKRPVGVPCNGPAV